MIDLPSKDADVYSIQCFRMKCEWTQTKWLMSKVEEKDK
jgi:hypothetical protein